jgi:hypothetical protein
MHPMAGTLTASLSAGDSPRTPPIGASWYAPKRAGLSAWASSGAKTREPNEVRASILPKSKSESPKPIDQRIDRGQSPNAPGSRLRRVDGILLS